jgi:ketosteroid isomerase-like protein
VAARRRVLQARLAVCCPHGQLLPLNPRQLSVRTAGADAVARPLIDRGHAEDHDGGVTRNGELFTAIIDRGFNQGDLSVADEVCSVDLIEHEYLAPEGVPGPEILKGQIADARRSVSDLVLTIEDLVEHGDQVWARMRARGREPRTGREVSFLVVDICRFADGMLVEHWGVPDRFALLHQAGLLGPPPTHP